MHVEVCSLKPLAIGSKIFLLQAVHPACWPGCLASWLLMLLWRLGTKSNRSWHGEKKSNLVRGRWVSVQQSSAEVCSILKNCTPQENVWRWTQRWPMTTIVSWWPWAATLAWAPRSSVAIRNQWTLKIQQICARFQQIACILDFHCLLPWLCFLRARLRISRNSAILLHEFHITEESNVPGIPPKPDAEEGERFQHNNLVVDNGVGCGFVQKIDHSQSPCFIILFLYQNHHQLGRNPYLRGKVICQTNLECCAVGSRTRTAWQKGSCQGSLSWMGTVYNPCIQMQQQSKWSSNTFCVHS